MIHNYRRVTKLFTTYTFGNAAQNVLSIILVPLYTSKLSPKEYGIIALMTVTVSILTQAISAPISNSLVRFYYKPDYKSKNPVLLFNLFLHLVIQAILLTIIYWFLTPFVCHILLSDDRMLLVVQLYTAILFLTPICNFLMTLIRLLELAKYYVIISIFMFLFSCGVILFGLLFLGIGVFALIWGTIAALCLGIIMSLPILIIKAKFNISLSIIKEPLKYGYPMMLYGYSNLMIQSGDRYVLNFFSSLNSVGLYSLGYKISSILNILVVLPLKQSLAPVVFKLESNPQEQKSFLASSANYYFLVGVFLALLLSLFSKEAVELIIRNKEYWHAWKIVPIISLSYILHGLTNIVGKGISMKNKTSYLSGTTFISAIVNLGLNFILIPYWGIIGAAFATLISYFIWNGLMVYYSAKFYDLHFDLKRLGYITIVGVGLYLMSLFIANIGHIYLNLTVKFLSLLSYPIIFFITGFFTPKEREYMQKLWRSIRINGLRETYAKLKTI